MIQAENRLGIGASPNNGAIISKSKLHENPLGTYQWRYAVAQTGEKLPLEKVDDVQAQMNALELYIEVARTQFVSNCSVVIPREFRQSSLPN